MATKTAFVVETHKYAGTDLYFIESESDGAVIKYWI